MAVRFITIEYDVNTKGLQESEALIKRISKDLGVSEDQVRDVSKAINEQTGIVNKLVKQEEQLIKARNEANDPDSIKKLNREIAKTRGQINKLTNQTNEGGKQMSQTMKRLGTIIAGAFAVSQIKSFITNAVDLAATMEQNRIAFTQFTGSAANANKLLGEIETFAASTPFQFPDLVSTSKNLLAFGIEQERILPIMKQLGDISAGTGKNIGELGLIYGKIVTKGKAQTEELNQLAEAGIPIIKTLGEQFGASSAQIFKMAENGELSAQVMQDAFKSMTSEGGLFFNLTEKQSQSTAGRISTLKDNVERLSRTFGEALLPAINTIVGGLTDLVQGINPFRTASDAMVESIFDGSRAMAEQKQELNALADLLRDTSLSEDARAEILERINMINPEVTKGLNAQNFEYDKLDENLDKVNAEMAENIALLRQQETVTFLNAKAAEQRNKQIEAELFLGGLIRENFKDQELLAKPLSEQIKILTERYEQLNGGLESVTDFSSIFLEAANQRTDAIASQKQIAEAAAIAEAEFGSSIKETSDQQKEGSKSDDERAKSLSKSAKSAKKLNDEIKLILLNGKLVRKDLEDTKGLSFAFKFDDDQIEENLEESIISAIEATEESGDAEIDVSITEIDTGPVDRFWERLRAQQAEAGEDSFLDSILGDPEQFANDFLGVASDIVGIISNFQEASTQKRLNDLDKEKEKEIANAGDSEAARIAIEEKFQKKTEELELQAAQERKRIALVEAAIAGALTIIKAIGQGPVFAAIAAAAVASQLAIIASSNFAEGVIDLEGPGTSKSDSIPAMLSKGESVMTADETKKFKPLLLAIRNKEITPKMIRPEVLERANRAYIMEARNMNVNWNNQELVKEIRGLKSPRGMGNRRML